MFGTNPVIAFVTEVLDVPVTGLSFAVTEIPYETVNPYSNVTVVDWLFAFTVPFRVPPVVVILVIEFVVAVGAAAVVVNVESAPFVVPVPFTPTTR